ncbi:hypothetical protein IT774_05040 [Salinimonas marina]|uniref:Uncharacterized protein n=1 Tax=Salinimonas marina TaxID=2785918 RepID=A0A7S9DZ32_9ALTE|nr:hypothetical protein [Salinimonas marina]QPG06540.1 hypothetical protein IT774_05040 [Salinimonas marina]
MHGQNADLNSKWVQSIIGIGMPLLTLSIGGLSAWMMKIDERQYTINKNYVSKAELKETMDNLSSIIEARRVEQEQANRLVLEEIRETNLNVQKLAISLERRTRANETQTF